MASIPITKEQFDNAVLVFAHYLGINIEKEEELLEIAKNALLHLPYGWELGIGEEEDNTGIPYFFNTETEDSVWQHPVEKSVVRQIRDARKKMKVAQMEVEPMVEDFGSREREGGDGRDRDERRERRDEDRLDEGSQRSNSRNSHQTDQQNRERENQRDGERSGRGRSAERQEAPEIKAIDNIFQKNGRPDERQTAQLAEDTTNADMVEELEDFDSSPNRGGTRAQEEGPPSLISRNSRSIGGGSPVQRHAQRSNVITDGAQSRAQANSWSSASAAQKLPRDSDDIPGRGREERSGALTANDRDRDRDRDLNRGAFSVNDRGRDMGAFSVSDRDRDSDRGAFSLDQHNRDRSAFSVGDRERDHSVERRDSNRDSKLLASPVQAMGHEQQHSSVNSHSALIGARRGTDSVLASPARPAEVVIPNDSVVMDDPGGAASGISAGLIKDLDVKNKILQNNVTHLEMYMKQLEAENEDSKVKLKATQRELEQALDSASKAEEAHKMAKRVLTTNNEQELVDMKRHYDRLLHDTKIEEDSKSKDALRRAMADREEDIKFRLKAKDREHSDTLSATNLTLAASKRQCSELEAEVRDLKTKQLGMENAVESQQSEITYKQTVAMTDLEDKLKASLSETKRLREEHVQLSSKLTSAMQMSQIAVAEAETAKIEAKSATVDNQTSQHALTQAVQRLHSFENETIKLKATVMALTQENEQYAHQVRKFQAAGNAAESQITDSDGEAKRFKLNAQADIARLSTRVLELESYTQVQRKQIDSYALSEDSTTRELQTKLDRLEYDLQRQREKTVEGENKAEATVQRLIATEKELMAERDALSRKDKMSREEKQRSEALGRQQQERRAQVEEENETLRNLVSDLRVQLSEASKQHRAEMLQLQREVGERIPQLTEKAVARVEAEYSARSTQDVAEVRAHYEGIIKRRDLDNMESLSLVSEKESRRQVAQTEIQFELENAKMKMMTFKRKADDLEAQLDEKTREARRLSEQLEDLRERVSSNREAQAQSLLDYGESYRTPMVHAHGIHQQSQGKRNVGPGANRRPISSVYVHSDDSLTMDESNDGQDENVNPQTQSTPVHGDSMHHMPDRHSHHHRRRDRQGHSFQASEAESIQALHEELRQMKESFSLAMSTRTDPQPESVAAPNTSTFSEVSVSSALVPRPVGHEGRGQTVDSSHISYNGSLRGISMLQPPSTDVSLLIPDADARNTSDLTAANTQTNATHVLSPSALETLFHSPMRGGHHVSGSQSRAVAAAVTSAGASVNIPPSGRESASYYHHAGDGSSASRALHYSNGSSSRSQTRAAETPSAVRNFPGFTTSAGGSHLIRQISTLKTPKPATYPSKSPYKAITGSRSTVKEDIIFNTDIYDGGFHEGYWKNKYANR